jgi:hypothetical protein
MSNCGLNGTLPHGRSPFWASSPRCPCSGFSDCAGETGLLIPSRLRSPLNSISFGSRGPFGGLISLSREDPGSDEASRIGWVAARENEG